MPSTSSSHAKQFQKDFSRQLQEATRENSALSADDAVKLAQARMLANNPFQPPADGSCPINGLPNELLGHIFFWGTHIADELDEDDLEAESVEDDDDRIDLADGWETTSDEDSEDASRGIDIVDAVSVDMDASIPFDAHSTTTSSSDLPELPFQVLVSHVCRQWRLVALSTPSLWTEIVFGYEEQPFNRCRVWIERSGNLPLDIDIDLTRDRDTDDCEGYGDEIGDSTTFTFTLGDPVTAAATTENAPSDATNGSPPPLVSQDESDSDSSSDWTPYYTEDDVQSMLDIICPHSDRWRNFSVSVYVYKHMHIILSRLETLPPAPLLDSLDLRHCIEEDLDTDATFQPSSLRLPFFVPFQGQAPQLKLVCLWGVHLAWEETTLTQGNSVARQAPTLLFDSAKQLSELELAFHTNDVRPSYTAFASMVQTSTNLTKLTLSASGPTGSPSDWFISDTQTLPKLSIPQLKVLDMRYHEPDYAIGLIQILDVPSLRELTLDYDSMDYTDFVKALAGEILNHRTSLSPSTRKHSILSQLEYLKISSLPCDSARIDLLLGELGNLQHLVLKCVSEEVTDIFRRLRQPINPSNPNALYCPSLKILGTTDITGKEMKDLVKARAAAGVPLRKVQLSSQDKLSEKHHNWLNENLQDGVDRFEDSDSDEFSGSDDEGFDDDEFP